MAKSIISLKGKKGIIFGIANDQSIAYGCAKAMQEAGADLAITYLNAKAEPHVKPLAEKLGSKLILPCDVEQPGQTEAVFEKIKQKWGRLDFVVHSIAFAPKEDLHGRVVDCSREGFSRAMDVSCHSFMRIAKAAEPLMDKGGCMITMSYYGSVMAVENYNIMGPVKAALESAVRYMAVELGPKGIRVHAVSPGPIKTRAASGISSFDKLIDQAQKKSSAHRLVTIDDVGVVSAMLVSDAGASLTGNVTYVDAGYHIVG